MAHRQLFTSESVTEGHPDKIADQIAGKRTSPSTLVVVRQRTSLSREGRGFPYPWDQMRSFVLFIALIATVACGNESSSGSSTSTALQADTTDLTALLPEDARGPFTSTTERVDSIVVAKADVPVRLRWTTGALGPHRYVTRLIAEYPPLPAGQEIVIEAQAGRVANIGTAAARVESITIEIRWTDGRSRDERSQVTLNGDGKFVRHAG